MGRKLKPEMRSQRAIYVTLAFVVGTALAAYVGQAVTGGVIEWQIAYSGASLLVVALILLFGVGSWARYLPDDVATTGQTGVPASSGKAGVVAGPVLSAPQPAAPNPSAPAPQGGEHHDPTH